jgi:hypothetical protein
VTSTDKLLRNPMTGIRACCARATSGHVAVAPPSSVAWCLVGPPSGNLLALAATATPSDDETIASIILLQKRTE